MNRGEVWWVNFDPSIGGAIRKRRPAVIVSNDISNRFLNRLQVVPVTGNTGRLYPSEAVITVGGKQSKAMADQIATVSRARVSGKIAALSDQDMHKIEDAIKVQLGIP